jgi:hypothetical protein
MTTRKATAKACLGWEMVWVEKQISPLRAARFGRNDVFGGVSQGEQTPAKTERRFVDGSKIGVRG